MGRSSLLIILLLCISSTARAQQSYDFRQVDSITYAYTLSENWNEVIEVGKYGLKNDIDYLISDISNFIINEQYPSESLYEILKIFNLI